MIRFIVTLFFALFGATAFAADFEDYRDANTRITAMAAYEDAHKNEARLERASNALAVLKAKVDHECKDAPAGSNCDSGLVQDVDQLQQLVADLMVEVGGARTSPKEYSGCVDDRVQAIECTYDSIGERLDYIEGRISVREAQALNMWSALDERRVRNAGLVAGIGAGVLVKPEIPATSAFDGAAPVGTQSVLSVGFLSEGAKAGVMLLGSAGLAAPRGYAFAGDALCYQYAGDSFRWGFGGGAGVAFYDKRGEVYYGASSSVIRLDGLMSWSAIGETWISLMPYAGLGEVSVADAVATQGVFGLEVRLEALWWVF